MYDRPGHVPPIQTEAEARVLGDGEVRGHGCHCELTDSCDSGEMSGVGFTGVEQFKDGKKSAGTSRHVMTDSADGHHPFGDMWTKTNSRNVKRVNNVLKINSSQCDNLVHGRGRILNLSSGEIKRGSMRGNLRGTMEEGGRR